MPKKTKIIFITTFIIVLIILGLFIFSKKNKNTTTNTTPVENKDFNPFGTSGTTNNSTNNSNGGAINWTNNISGEQSKFFQITKFAVAGASFFEGTRAYTKTTGEDYTSVPITVPVGSTGTKTNTTPKTTESITETFPGLRYVEKATGHIYQMDLTSSNATRVSNSTIPSVYEVVIDGLAKTFIYRYVSPTDKSITSYMATIGETKGSFLPSDIVDISLSPNQNKFFYLVKNSNGVLGFIGSFTDTKKTQVFNSPFTEWTSQWVTDQKIFLNTKPSWSVSGSLFSLDIKNSVLTKVLGGIKGLTSLVNKDGSSILYGASLEVGPKLWIFNTKDHTMKDLDSYGLPEKCVWSNDNINLYCAVPNTIVGIQYPDYWYQGLTSFEDYFVKINTETGTKETIANSEKETPIDATKLFLNKEETELFFINKKDSTLWSLDIN